MRNFICYCDGLRMFEKFGRKYLNLGKKNNNGENYVVSSLTVCIHYLILVG